MSLVLRFTQGDGGAEDPLQFDHLTEVRVTRAAVIGTRRGRRELFAVAGRGPGDAFAYWHVIELGNYQRVEVDFGPAVPDITADDSTHRKGTTRHGR